MRWALHIEMLTHANVPRVSSVAAYVEVPRSPSLK